MSLFPNSSLLCEKKKKYELPNTGPANIKESHNHPCFSIPPVSHTKVQVELLHTTVTPQIFWSPAVWEAVPVPASRARNPKGSQEKFSLHRLQATSSPDEPGCLLFLTTFHHPPEPLLVPPATGVIGNHILISNSAQCRELTSLTDPHEEIYHGFLVITPDHRCLLGIQREDS